MKSNFSSSDLALIYREYREKILQSSSKSRIIYYKIYRYLSLIAILFVILQYVLRILYGHELQAKPIQFIFKLILMIFLCVILNWITSSMKKYPYIDDKYFPLNTSQFETNLDFSKLYRAAVIKNVLVMEFVGRRKLSYFILNREDDEKYFDRIVSQIKTIKIKKSIRLYRVLFVK
jgi:hypothetical protein